MYSCPVTHVYNTNTFEFMKTYIKIIKAPKQISINI